VLSEATTQDFIQSGTIVQTKNKTLLLGYGKRTWLSPKNNSTKPLFYFPDFFLTTPTPWFFHEHTLEIDPDELHLSLTSLISEKVSLKWHCPYQEFFKSACENLLLNIHSKKLQKAVPYIFEISPTRLTSDQLVYSLRSALNYMKENPAYLYGFWEDSQGILGVTPEILFSLSSRQNKWIIETSALASTRKKESPWNLLEDKKSLLEHTLVVEGIAESLKEFGFVYTGETEELMLPHLTHLHTPLHAMTSKKPDVIKLIHALHPTPALGAYPRSEGSRWLKDYQQNIDRKRFGAPVGFFNQESHQGCLFVAIRNMQWFPHEILIGAGCGVVQGSRIEKEWEEINLKIQAIKEMLAL
jgi:menaquinone-specific isochorismate synthase